MEAEVLFDRLESNVQSYARAFPRIFDRARGAELWDDQGRRYLDFLSGAGSLNYGHNHPVCRQALLQYIERDGIAHSLDLHTSAKSRFLQAIHDILLVPRELEYVVQFPGPTGTNAVEAALKIARKVTGRTNVVCFTNAFHGVSLGSLAATSNRYFRDVGGVPLGGTTRMPFDGYLGEDLDTMSYFERVLDDPSSGIDHPAAVIVETVQGEGGLNTASAAWLQRLQSLCRQHGMLLIVDDIQAGCGRTGQFFSFEQARLYPDVVLLSKSLSGFGLPLSVVMLRSDLDQWQPGEHNGTFRGNNHAFVTATAVLERFWQSPAFAGEVRDKGAYLNRRLHAIRDLSPTEFTEVRGRGMMQGLCCAIPGRAEAIAKRAFELGVVIERSGAHDEVIKCMMPLTIGRGEMEEGLDILERAALEVLERSHVLPSTPASATTS